VNDGEITQFMKKNRALLSNKTTKSRNFLKFLKNLLENLPLNNISSSSIILMLYCLYKFSREIICRKN